VARIRPSLHAIQAGLNKLEAREDEEQEEVALVDQDKKWSGEAEREREEERGREGASDQEQEEERADDSRTGEEDETGAVAIEIESEGTIRVIKEVARDSLGDYADIEENIQLPQRPSVWGDGDL
jgi:hypothetical protein